MMNRKDPIKKHDLSTGEHIEEVAAIDQELADQYTVAITPQTDNPDMPAFTCRSVMIGVVWAVMNLLTTH